ncbi:hypothetical protein KGD82_17155 [Nocardiopsis eucommiae]|uniref:Uncharacterized protein n=1 Tax=Nocardiopsis eucommiae TaxID=2831970 RepID=A0A975L824_9ACTN|nr:hypothetical protein KGD82_17155 [Nocardiopsis eucommiae]
MPEATTFGERRDLLRDWLDPAPAPLVEESVAVQEATAELPGESAPTERGTPSFFAPSPPTGIDPTPASRADTPAPDPLTDEAVPEPEDDLEEAPDPFADDDTDTAEQETWAGGGRSHTFLGVARRRPGPEPEHDPLSIFGRPPRPAAPEDPSTEPDPPVSRDEAARSTAADEEPRETWTIAASTDRPEPRAPEDAPPLAVRPLPEQEPVDYAAETEPETDENLDDSDDNWPTQYADLPSHAWSGGTPNAAPRAPTSTSSTRAPPSGPNAPNSNGSVTSATATTPRSRTSAGRSPAWTSPGSTRSPSPRPPSASDAGPWSCSSPPSP